MKAGSREHVQKLIDEEKALEAMFYGQGEEIVEQGTEVEEEVETAEEVTEVVEEQRVEDAGSEETTEGEKPKRISWKAKYDELDVRFRNYRATFDAKIFKLRSQVTQLTEKSKRDSQTIDELSKRLANNTPEPDVFEGADLSEDEIDMLGPEAIAIMKKMMKTAVKNTEAKFKHLKPKEQEVDTTELDREYNTAKENFITRLASIAPNYSKFDRDAGFHEYLNEEDPVNGETRFYWFKRAQNSGNVQAVASYFLDYEQRVEEPQNKLNRHITPSGKGGPSTPRPETRGDSNVYAYSDYKKFYADVNKGRYKGRADEARELDKKLDKALLEGRIDFGK